jgi:hypothetical protein
MALFRKKMAVASSISQRIDGSWMTLGPKKGGLFYVNVVFNSIIGPGILPLVAMLWGERLEPLLIVAMKFSNGGHYGHRPTPFQKDTNSLSTEKLIPQGGFGCWLKNDLKHLILFYRHEK